MKALFEIFLWLIQLAGMIALIADIVLLVMLKHGYELNAKFTEDEEDEK